MLESLMPIKNAWRLRCLFLTWALETTRHRRTEVEGLASRMENVLNRRANSIWMMNKEELIQVGLREIPGAACKELAEMRKDELLFVLKERRAAEKKEREDGSKLADGLGQERGEGRR